MNKTDVKKWARRRRESIPAATWIDVIRNGARAETFDLLKDAEYDELANFVHGGDELIALADDKSETARATVDLTLPKSAGFQASPEPVGLSDRMLQTAIRESHAQATGVMAQVESMLESMNTRYNEAEAKWQARERELLDRIADKDRKIDEEKEKSRTDYEAQLRLRSAEHDQKMAEMKSAHELAIMSRAFDKASEIGDAIISGILKTKNIGTRLSAIWNRIPGTVHMQIADALTDDDKIFIANLLEDAEKDAQPKTRKRRLQEGGQ